MLQRIHQSSLYPSFIQIRDSHLEGAGFFPFHNRDGSVHAYMLVWPESRRIVMLDAREGLVKSTVPLVLDVATADLKDLSKDDFDQYGRLWHYDPWWVLAEKRYRGHPAVPVLKATNTVDYLGADPLAGWFSKDLRWALGDLRKLLPARKSSVRSGKHTVWRLRSSWPSWS